MEAEDIPFVKKLEVDSNLSPWTLESYTENLTNIDSINLVAVEIPQRIVGFLVTRLITHEDLTNNQIDRINEIEIYNIAVDINYRRLGIGRYLLEECQKLINHGEKLQIWLEVRSSNVAATNFYFKLGFERKYIRKSFYSNPPEDALVMCLEK